MLLQGSRPGVLVLLLLPVALSAQGSRPSTITVNDPRPLAEAALQLEALYGQVITYEDPEWQVPSQTEDVTDSVRRDTMGMSDGEKATLTRVLIPRAASLTVSLPHNADVSGARVATLLQELITANARAGNPGQFKHFESPGKFHIGPANASYHSPLDVPINVSYANSNGIDILQYICDQISLSTGRSVTIGVVPTNSLAHYVGSYHASQENARNVLSSVLDTIGPGYSWQLLFDPGDHNYALNIHVVGNTGE